MYRKQLFDKFITLFGIDRDDTNEDIERYETFHELLTRRVKPREIIADSDKLLAPIDANVLSISKVNNNYVSIFRGMSYNLCEFLYSNDRCVLTPNQIDKTLKAEANSDMYSIIMKSSLGDYHRIHSPANFTIEHSKIIAGPLKPINRFFLWMVKVY